MLAQAFQSVDVLQYLVDVDMTYDVTRNSGGHHCDVIDIAHARWATSTSITALDLVAAAFGRSLGGNPGPKEWDLGTFSEKSPQKQIRAAVVAIPSPAKNWVSKVLLDPDFPQIWDARTALTHRRLPRRLYPSIGTRAPDPRLDVVIGADPVPVGDLVRRSRDLAARQLLNLLVALPAI